MEKITLKNKEGFQDDEYREILLISIRQRILMKNFPGLAGRFVARQTLNPNAYPELNRKLTECTSIEKLEEFCEKNNLKFLTEEELEEVKRSVIDKINIIDQEDNKDK